jgi:hypothetical protein
MKIGFFLALRHDVQHYLHASCLVAEAKLRMPGVKVVQLSDADTPLVPKVDEVKRFKRPASLLKQRLTLYAELDGDWLLVDTDVSIRNDVRGVFSDDMFDVALCDRNWPHLKQGDQMLHLMPFNTGVVFTRSRAFWCDVLQYWRSLSGPQQLDWLSEQIAVYHIVRTGRYRVKILPGMAYNYPPNAPQDQPVIAAMLHYKGNRKPWLSQHAYAVLSRP